jgi:hypothetical protein
MNSVTNAAFEEAVKADALLTPKGVRELLAKMGMPGLFEFSKDKYGQEYLHFGNSTNKHFQAALLRQLQDCFGHTRLARMNGNYPVEELAKTKNKWVPGLSTYGYQWGEVDSDGDPIDPSSQSPEIASILKVLETRIKDIELAVARQIAKGEVAFDDLPFYYKTGAEVYFNDDSGNTIAGLVASSNIQSSWFGSQYLAVTLDIIHAVQGELVPGKYVATLGSYEGMKKLDELHIKPATDDVKKILTEYGKLYVECTKGATYLSYNGQLTRASWWSNETFRADGRVMIDINSFKRVDNDQYTSELRNSGLVGVRDGGEGQHKIVTYAPTENELWRTYPYVYGFSFRAKRWGKMEIKGLSQIAWRSDSFDKLVLADDEKKLIRALVEHNDGSFSDLIEGKGGGCIFLLHGPPGQGKTLTAETIAELLKRPLYAISVGELGVTPDQLEERLRVILDVATVWNAVILLDEADIYLEARDERDITRNAMVGVFLRLLEYHHGVLFLTTNRVKNIDTAFYSRISVALHFAKGADDKREKIWNNLLESSGITGIDVKELAPIDINGRQIKNAIRLSQTLAKSEGKKVETATLRKVISLMTAFDRERSEASSI